MESKAIEVEVKKATKPKVIKMIKDGVKANVHPDEVDNYKLAGYK